MNRNYQLSIRKEEMQNEICKSDPPLWKGSSVRITDKAIHQNRFAYFARRVTIQNNMADSREPSLFPAQGYVEGKKFCWFVSDLVFKICFFLNSEMRVCPRRSYSEEETV